VSWAWRVLILRERAAFRSCGRSHPNGVHLNSVHLNAVHYTVVVPGSENAAPRNTRHSRDDVVAAALRILDQYGLPDLTMRRLGAALDVQPSALYWHFPNKQTLLAALADRIVDRPATPVASHDGESEWMTHTRAEAISLRDALLAYRDGAEVVSSTFALGLGTAAPLDRLAAAIAAGGFDAQTSSDAATALLHFVLGHVSHEQQRLQYDSLGVLDGGVSPSDLDSRTTGQDAFEFGVALLVTGLDRLSPRERTAGPTDRPERISRSRS
jgi:TetR/AcrR family tetracycline transcriptional repressor